MNLNTCAKINQQELTSCRKRALFTSATYIKPAATSLSNFLWEFCGPSTHPQNTSTSLGRCPSGASVYVARLVLFSYHSCPVLIQIRLTTHVCGCYNKEQLGGETRDTCPGAPFVPPNPCPISEIPEPKKNDSATPQNVAPTTRKTHPDTGGWWISRLRS